MSHSEARVSVLIPFTNEQATIEQSIMSIIEQDYKGWVEILAVNDGSTDSSVDIVKRLSRKHDNIKLIQATGSEEAEARNTGISVARGNIIVNFSAHAVAAHNFLEVLLSKLTASSQEVAGVGCKHVAYDRQDAWSLAFAEAIRSAFGGYGTSYYQGDIERFVESVAYTAYKAEVFDKVGLFDPDAVRGVDAEFNLRLANSGYKLLYTPQTVVYHCETESPRAFFAKMGAAGAARMKVTRKHPSSFRLIYAAPSIALFALALLVVGSVLRQEFIYPLVGLLLIYLFCSLFDALKIMRRTRLRSALRVMLAFPLIHVGYGLGFLKEAIRPSRRVQISRSG